MLTQKIIGCLAVCWLSSCAAEDQRVIEVHSDDVPATGWLDVIPGDELELHEAALALACTTECNGDWGRHGLYRESFCLCRTTDRGETCHDGTDCDGVCLFTHVEDGVGVGVCSEFETEFGCYQFIGDGTRDEATSVEQSFPTICVD